MHTILEAFKNSVSEELKDKLSASDLEKIPSIILSCNIENLMEIHGITSDRALSQSIRNKGFDLSTAQVNRVRKGTSEATSSTLFKLALGLNIEPVDFMYLFDPAGFTSKGIPIGKFYTVDESVLTKAIEEAYQSLATSQDVLTIKIKTLVSVALSSYRASLTGDYETLKKELMQAMRD